MRSTIFIALIFWVTWGPDVVSAFRRWRERRYLTKRMHGALDFVDCVEDIDEWRNK